MKRTVLTCAGLIAVFLLSCNNKPGRLGDANGENTILQQGDETISLNLDKAACYIDKEDPSSNTAEWNVIINKPGRYKVWISSATKDTIDLDYSNAVKVHFLDSRLEVDPVCDKVIKNSGEVSFPFYRADSYMGSFYFSEPGEYNIQVISDKVIPKEARAAEAYLSENIRLISVFLTPMSR